jgi:large subunit ribosomal protein L29
MKFEDIKDLTVEELRKRRLNQAEEMFQLKMKHSLGQVNNPIEIRNKRKDIARIQTALSMKMSR